jgi:hypothetical protein
MQFADRDLPGFVCVDPAGFAADDALARWVQRGLDFVSQFPVKPVGTSKEPTRLAIHSAPWQARDQIAASRA